MKRGKKLFLNGKATCDGVAGKGQGGFFRAAAGFQYNCIIFHFNNFAMDAADGDNLIAHRQIIEHSLHSLLLFFRIQE